MVFNVLCSCGNVSSIPKGGIIRICESHRKRTGSGLREEMQSGNLISPFTLGVAILEDVVGCLEPATGHIELGLLPLIIQVLRPIVDLGK